MSKRNGFDRCPKCRGPLTFEGIDTTRGWVRWAGCIPCSTPNSGVWVLSDANGTVLGVSHIPPGKHQFKTGKQIWVSDGE